MMILFYFVKSTKMIEYPIDIKIRHKTKKTMELQINSIINYVAVKQINVRIINEFFDSSPK
jgi:hypothetical protein